MPTARVAIVDDDHGVLKALARLIAARSFRPEMYLSVHAFLESLSLGPPDRLLVTGNADMTGLELQRKLSRAGFMIPTIVITAHDDQELQQQCQSAGERGLPIEARRPEHPDCSDHSGNSDGSASEQARVWGRREEL